MGKGRSRPNSPGGDGLGSRLLIVRSGGIGDVLQLTPALVGIREFSPSIEVRCAGRAEVYEVLAERGLVAEVSSLDGGPLWRAFTPDLPLSETVRDSFEGLLAMIVFGHPVHPDLRERLGAKLSTFPSFPEPTTVDEPMWERIHRCVRVGLPGLPTVAPGRTVHLPRRNVADGSGVTTVTCFPGSGSPRKNWPFACWLELARALFGAGIACRFLLGPAEGRASELALRVPWVAFERPTSLRELADRLEHTTVFVGNDTGPTHLAAQLGVPTIALFGPSSEPCWEPFGLAVEVLRGEPGTDWPATAFVLERVLDRLARPEIHWNP